MPIYAIELWNLSVVPSPSCEEAAISRHLDEETFNTDSITDRMMREMKLLSECRTWLDSDVALGEPDVRTAASGWVKSIAVADGDGSIPAAFNPRLAKDTLRREANP